MGRDEQVLCLWKQVFGDFGGFWETFFRCAWKPDHCLCIEEAGQIQAALYWFDCHCGGPWAYIFAVATHPDHRGRGLCRALMEKTHARLEALGYHGALLVPAEPGLRQMYAAMDYREGTVLPEFPRPAGLQPVSAREYAAARRALLPPGGVIQEGDILTLLEETGARFFAAEGCILACEGQRVLEYLDGSVPEGTRPFAMVHPFREDAVCPEYFAFALD